MGLINKKITEEMVNHYAEKSDLFGGEKLFKEYLIQNKINNKILDLGVGGGRTTDFLLGMFKKYIGLDIMPEMIEVCKKKYASSSHADFVVGNSEDLSTFEKGTFDAVFFSFNGIDYSQQPERIETLKQIKNLLTDDGVFCFSFHNIYHIYTQYNTIRKRNTIKHWLIELYRLVMLRAKNGRLYSFVDKPYLHFYDGVNWFTQSLMYSNMHYQLKITREQGFDIIQLFNYETGEIINEGISKEELKTIPWIGLICKKNK